MKKLVIIVPTVSTLNSYLSDAGFIYDKITRLSDRTCYKMNMSTSLEFIEFLVFKFCLNDFSVRCHDGIVSFRVRS